MHQTVEVAMNGIGCCCLQEVGHHESLFPSYFHDGMNLLQQYSSSISRLYSSVLDFVLQIGAVCINCRRIWLQQEV